MESGLGETISETRSGFRGVALVLSQSRDQAGRLKAQDLPEGYRLVYEYSPITGRILRTGHDLNRNGNIDLASLDRVSETRESYTRDPGNGPWYRVTESIAYLQSGAATPTVLSTTKEQLTGFTGNVVARRIVIGASGQATTYTTTIDRAAKTRTESIQRPGVAGAETRVFVNGALRSESTPGQSGTVIYTYDGLGRIATVAHPATGTTTYQYRGEGTLVESVTNHLGHVTRYAYYTSGPLAGQVQTMTNPELETVHGVRHSALKNTTTPDVQLKRSFELFLAGTRDLLHLNTVHETAAHLPGRQLVGHRRSSHLPGFRPENDL